MLAMDEAQSLFSVSTYRSPDFKPLEAYNLSMPLLALDYLTGRKSFVSPWRRIFVRYVAPLRLAHSTNKRNVFPPRQYERGCRPRNVEILNELTSSLCAEPRRDPLHLLAFHAQRPPPLHHAPTPLPPHRKSHHPLYPARPRPRTARFQWD